MSYPAPAAPAPAPINTSNGFGVTALVLGIIAVVTGFIPILGMGAFILGPLAIIFGIIGLTRKGRKRGTSITGIVLGAVGIIVAIIVTAITAAFVDGVSQSIDDVDKQMNQEISVEYIANVTKGKASVTYGAMDGTSDKTITKKWTHKNTLKGLDSATIIVTGDFQTSGQKVSCEVKVDGKSVSKNSGEDSATCTGNNF